MSAFQQQRLFENYQSALKHASAHDPDSIRTALSAWDTWLASFLPPSERQAIPTPTILSHAQHFEASK